MANILFYFYFILTFLWLHFVNLLLLFREQRIHALKSNNYHGTKSSNGKEFPRSPRCVAEFEYSAISPKNIPCIRASWCVAGAERELCRGQSVRHGQASAIDVDGDSLRGHATARWCTTSRWLSMTNLYVFHHILIVVRLFCNCLLSWNFIVSCNLFYHLLRHLRPIIFSLVI